MAKDTETGLISLHGDLMDIGLQLSKKAEALQDHLEKVNKEIAQLEEKGTEALKLQYLYAVKHRLELTITKIQTDGAVPTGEGTDIFLEPDIRKLMKQQKKDLVPG